MKTTSSRSTHHRAPARSHTSPSRGRGAHAGGTSSRTRTGGAGHTTQRSNTSRPGSASPGTSSPSASRSTGSEKGSTVARNADGDTATISRKEEAPRSEFVNPLNHLESEQSGGTTTTKSETSSAEAHANGDRSKGSFDVGASAEASKGKETVTKDGNTTHTRSEFSEGHAKVNASGDLSEGRFGTEVDVGASTHASERIKTSGETNVGGVRFGGEAEAGVSLDAEAGTRSRTDVDLANGRLSHDSRTALGVDVKADAKAASEVEAFGVTRRDEVSTSAQAKAKAESESHAQIDENGVDLSTKNSAEAKVAADVGTSTKFSTDAGSVETSARAEASAFAEAHADGHFTLTEDELSYGFRGGASAATQLQAEGTVKGETKNGSKFSVNGGANTGSVGAGLGVEFARRKGETSYGFETSGGLAIVGGHLNASVTIADRDIAEGATAPLAAGGATFSAIGDAAQSAGQVTESMKQSANSRQDFIHQMGEVPTGNLIADTGIAAAETVHGAYTNAVDFADTFTDTAAQEYHRVGQNISSTASRMADGIEQGVGEVMDSGVRKAHSAYQYGRAVGGGFMQGLGQGAYNITSLGGLLW